MLRISSAITLLLLLPFQAYARDIGTTSFYKENGFKAHLGFYWSGCSEDNLPECGYVFFSCEGTQFEINFGDFNPQELAAWLAHDSSNAVFSTNSRRYKLQAFRIDYNDMNDSWDLVFRLSHDADQDIFQGLSMAKRMWLMVGKREQALPVNKHMHQFVRACVAAPS